METIDRFLHSSYDELARTAVIIKFLPLLAERFARQRLRALAKVEGMIHDGKTHRPLPVHPQRGPLADGHGLFQHLADDQAVAWSGGSEPASSINPAAV